MHVYIYIFVFVKTKPLSSHLAMTAYQAVLVTTPFLVTLRVFESIFLIVKDKLLRLMCKCKLVIVKIDVLWSVAVFSKLFVKKNHGDTKI